MHVHILFKDQAIEDPLDIDADFVPQVGDLLSLEEIGVFKVLERTVLYRPPGESEQHAASELLDPDVVLKVKAYPSAQ